MFLKQAVALFAFLALPLAVPPLRAAEGADTFTFVQIADTQFGLFKNNDSWEAETENFERVVAEINRLKPAFVVICGDLVNLPGDAAQIAEFKRIAAKVSPEIPVHLVPGNHDVGNNPTRESIELYRKNFGATNYSFRYRDFVGIVVDSDLIVAPELVGPEADAQYAWLRDELEKSKSAKYRFVFQHHPFFLAAPGEPTNGHLNVPQEFRARYYDLIKRAGVTHILAGHLHRYNAAKDGDLNMIAVGAVGRPPNGTPSGMALVTVSPLGVDYRYVTLDQLPIIPGRSGAGTSAAPSPASRGMKFRIM